MPREKTFDRDVVLDKAMELFWRQGYEATSMQNLVDHMGINRGSLYATFGGKHELFLAAVDHYRRHVAARRMAALHEPGSGKQAIRRFFADVLRFSLAEGRFMGCLLTNSAVERAAFDPDTGRQVAAGMATMEDAFVAALERAKAAGEIGPERDCRALARFLTSSLQGLRVTAKAHPDPQALRDIVELTLSVLA